jgi:sorting nexin-29
MESLGVRAVTQCGFRKEHGTIDALFTLTHLINQARHNKRKLYVVFVDFKKAFDTVPRDLLLERCRQLGIHGRFLSLLERLYDTIQAQVVVNGKIGDPIDTCLGTKQGSELSPLLFGLFVEMLPAGAPTALSCVYICWPAAQNSAYLYLLRHHIA